MSQLVSSLGSFISSNSGALKGLATAAGAAGNIYSGISNARNLGSYNATQSYIQNLVRNPAKMAAAAAKFQQPLSAGLTDAVTNQVQAQLAERGLGGSPSAMQATLAQALAPYIQQNQQTAIQELMRSLGAGTNAQPMKLPSVDLSKLLAQLKVGSSGSNTDPWQTIADANTNMAGDAGLQLPDIDMGVVA